MKFLHICTFFLFAYATTCKDTNSRNLRFYVASDTNNWATCSNMPSGGGKATIITTASIWTAQAPTHNWIWSANAVGSTTNDQTCMFSNDFYIPGTLQSAFLDVAADDSILIWVNGANIGCDQPTGTFKLETQQLCNITEYVTQGMNLIQLSVTNNGGYAGLLYTITIDTLIVLVNSFVDYRNT